MGACSEEETEEIGLSRDPLRPVGEARVSKAACALTVRLTKLLQSIPPRFVERSSPTVPRLVLRRGIDRKVGIPALDDRNFALLPVVTV